MELTHSITLFFSGVNITIICMMFLRYSRFYKKEMAALRYCLILMLVSIANSILMTVVLLVPEGPLLTSMLSFVLFGSSAVNILFMLAVINLAVDEGDSIIRYQKFVFVVPVLFFVLYATNGVHGMMVTSVTKEADSFLYSVDFGILHFVAAAYSFLLSALAIYYIFRGGSQRIIQEARIRWLLLLSTCIPSILSYVETVVPILGKLHISHFFVWVPITIVCYLFFGYLFTAREMALQATDEAFVIFDLRGNCADINDAGTAFFSRYCGEDRPRSECLAGLLGLEDLSQLKQREFELEGTDGQHTYYQINLVKLSNGINQYCGNGYLIREVTEYRRKMSQLSTLAAEDPLTGAKNRRYMEEMAGKMLVHAAAHRQPISVFMLDIDHFKKVNDTHGHVAGDEVLVRLYQILAHNVREGDFVIRYGGEEFMILCEGVSGGEARAVAERIRHSVEETPFATTEGNIQITVSIGLYTKIPSAGQTDITHFIELADACLYKAKAGGRNRVEYEVGEAPKVQQADGAAETAK